MKIIHFIWCLTIVSVAPVNLPAQKQITNSKWLVHLEKPFPNDFYLEFKKDSLLLLAKDGQTLDVSSYSIKADSLHLRKLSGPMPCEEGSEAMYKIKWLENGAKFLLDKIYDHCPFRSTSIADMTVKGKAIEENRSKFFGSVQKPVGSVSNSTLSQPPKTPSQPVTETYFGVQVTDPYRWLENLSDSSVENWYRQQAAYSKEQLSKLPHQDKIMQEFLSFARSMSNTRRTIQFTENFVIYSRIVDIMTSTSEIRMIYTNTGKDTLLFGSKDPALWDTRQYQLFNAHLSPDEKYLCIAGTKKDGSEFQCLRFFDISLLKLLPDTVFEEFLGWMPDSRSIVVRKFATTDVKADSLYRNLSSQIYTIGQKKLTDVLSTRSAPHLNLNPDMITRIMASVNSRYAIGCTQSASAYYNTVYFAPVDNYSKMGSAWKFLLSQSDSVTDMKIYGNYVYYISPVGNSNYSLKRVHLLSGKKETIASDPEKILHDFEIVNNTLYYVLRHGLQCQLFAASIDNVKNSKPVPLPAEGMGSIYVTADNKTILLSMKSWIGDAKEYKLNIKEQKWIISPINTMHHYEWDGKVESKEVWVKARDGVMVPLTLIYSKEIKLDGQNPGLLTGYGSYGNSQFPFLHPGHLILASKGIVVAIAHVRGGGELGNKWHLAGMKATKANTWNDFIDCAEWLISNKYTSPNRLIGEGTSAGGILIGRAVTERPDLFCAAIMNVGALNVSRFAFTPNGPNHFEEFGNPAIEKDFIALESMDAYLHIKENTAYPAVYITAGWNDSRVIPWQPAKFAARLQNSTSSGKPVYLVVNFDAGHGPSANPMSELKKAIEKTAFEFQQWNYDPYQNKKNE